VRRVLAPGEQAVKSMKPVVPKRPEKHRRK